MVFTFDTSPLYLRTDMDQNTNGQIGGRTDAEGYNINVQIILYRWLWCFFSDFLYIFVVVFADTFVIIFIWTDNEESYRVQLPPQMP